MVPKPKRPAPNNKTRCVDSFPLSSILIQFYLCSCAEGCRYYCTTVPELVWRCHHCHKERRSHVDEDTIWMWKRESEPLWKIPNVSACLMFSSCGGTEKHRLSRDTVASRIQKPNESMNDIYLICIRQRTKLQRLGRTVRYSWSTYRRPPYESFLLSSSAETAAAAAAAAVKSLVAFAKSLAMLPAFFLASAMAASIRDSFFLRKSFKKES